ncbi:TIGR03862 family flavoprotein [Arenimonas caeni]|uniref:Aminoacetone oxidase family FAD-binding enzyme n=2 Tax=Arenimonas caeni TaxID=2058085 RepID=A0A2P6MBE1_9GAMM|nr:TIGR03862 family flavoprotein [Arenimonas caeni]PRH83308.1 aminoacetone oxidase family FAD-binding enzyme [Arenimonas caeni]
MHVTPLPGLAIVGGGPAGLMAAEAARAEGVDVDLFDAMGSVGRKVLIAGKGGLNLTHSEGFESFVGRYGGRSASVRRWLEAFGADDLRQWARGLGIETFVGSSGRVFPSDLKAAPLLRGWVRRLREQGVRFHLRHRWTGFGEGGALRFDTPEGPRSFRAGATVLALGGGSWPQLGSDGAWAPMLADAGFDVAPLQPANCGFDAGWSEHFASRHAGAPLKPVRLALGWESPLRWRQGECVATATGLEGSLVYALSAALRERITQHGEALLLADLVPGRDVARLARDLARPRNGRSLSEHLRRQAGLSGAKAGLLRECLPAEVLNGEPAGLAAAIKALPIRLTAARPIAEAISSAGGLRLEALDDDLMVRDHPGLFAAGEMLDWEAPTGGYLLTACHASGLLAGRAAARWLARGGDGSVGGQRLGVG